MSSTPAKTKVRRQDIRKIIFDNFNDTDYRFSNDEILRHLNETEQYKTMNLDVLDFEDVLLEMEESGLLRPIAQNFNTRYYKIMTELEAKTCTSCSAVSWFAEAEDPKLCPQCGSKNLS
jgi:ribosomal protein S27AE